MLAVSRKSLKLMSLVGTILKRWSAEPVELWGRLDILVNNAFNTKEPDGSAVDLSEEAWDYAMNVLVKSMFLGAK